jgi:chorismate mutase
LLSEVNTRATNAGIDPAFAQAFFQDQIDASKEAQRALFAHWKHVPPTEPAPDLQTVVRPQLDQLTQRLISALVQIEPVRATPDCPLRVTQTLANWKSMTTYDASRSASMRLALSHVCATGGLGAVG